MQESAENHQHSNSDEVFIVPDPLKPEPGIELFFGLVGPTGTDLDSVCKQLSNQLHEVGYDAIHISLSDMILEISGSSPSASGEYHRIKFLMEEGTRLTEKTKLGDFVARLGILDIVRKRKSITGDERAHGEKSPRVIRFVLSYLLIEQKIVESLPKSV
jgi:hypothetical protein